MNNDLTESQRPRTSYTEVTLRYSMQVCSADTYEYHAVRVLHYNFHINPDLDYEFNGADFFL
jgi:hypothetical protein